MVIGKHPRIYAGRREAGQIDPVFVDAELPLVVVEQRQANVPPWGGRVPSEPQAEVIPSVRIRPTASRGLSHSPAMMRPPAKSKPARMTRYCLRDIFSRTIDSPGIVRSLT